MNETVYISVAYGMETMRIRQKTNTKERKTGTLFGPNSPVSKMLNDS